MTSDLPSIYLLETRTSSSLLWGVAEAACESVGITIHELIDRGLRDDWPADERVESVWFVVGPPLTQELRDILDYQLALEAEAEKEKD